MSPIFYFRGLNTYGDDNIHFGPLVLGRMFGPLKKALKEKGIEIIPVENMGSGRLDEVILRAGQQLIQNPVWQQAAKAHFFAHSTGALVAQALLHRPEIQKKILSLLSFGAPHSGALVVNHLDFLARQHPMLHFVGTLFEKKFLKRKVIFKDLRTESVSEFNKKYPTLPSVRYASLVCHTAYAELSHPMKFLARIAHQTEHGWLELKSDGLIFAESQKIGEILAEFQLDHLSEIGYFFFLDKKLKAKHQAEFDRLLDTTISFWRSFK